MNSIIAVTDNYILQAPLLAKHRQTLEWISASVLWKRELAFFQKLLEKYAPDMTEPAERQRLEHFQNIVLYYRFELIDKLTSALRGHEKKLAEMFETKDETKVEYFKEHEGLMTEMQSLSQQFTHNKEELYAFIETFM
jgi:hypothetical protein